MRSKLREGEKILFATKKHWVVLTKPIFIALLIVSLTFFFYSEPQLKSLAGWGLLAFLISLIYLTYAIFERKYNIWVVTNMRVIDEWGIFTHNLKESPLEKVNNISYKQTVSGRILNYGDIEIQTAAEVGTTALQFVPFPKEFCNAVTDAQQKLKFSEQDNTALDTQDTKECPFCAERIKKKAKVCRFCGKEVKADEEKEVTVEQDSSVPATETKPTAYVNPKAYLRSRITII